MARGAERMGHLAIRASAGSGKTYALAHRYIRLLAEGVAPDRIAALTFSRKAAGEILDKVVVYLSGAAASSGEARKRAGDIGLPGTGTGDFLRLLRLLVNNIHRLHVGTLDSFAVGMIRAFPMELGIPADIRVIDTGGAEAISARGEVLREIFTRRSPGRAAEREFLDAFRQATFGREQKDLSRSLDTFLDTYHSLYRAAPGAERWGREDVIWPGGSPWLAEGKDPLSASRELEGMLGRMELPEKIMARWRVFLEAARGFTARSPWSRDIEYLFEKLIAASDDLRRGEARISMEKKECVLGAKECRLALALVSHIMKTEITAALEKTRGIRRILDIYERQYDTTVRRKGTLTFEDVQFLLTANNRMSGGALISRSPGAPKRLYIDHRLDCALDHWLLDEFQDTSDLQWQVLENLADEIIRDAGGRRSFFYVGDVKQAIYGWRGGNARLFEAIRNKYPGTIERRSLDTSRRSCQAVLDAVNAVFGELPRGIIPESVVDRWESAWSTHRRDAALCPERGYAGILEPPCDGGGTVPSPADRYTLAARLLREIDPPRRGLSAAVLVRSNAAGEEVTDLLRRECGGMTVVHEGRAPITDNPVVSLLLSLVKYAAHPGDTLAWRHLQMSPLGPSLGGGGRGRDHLPARLLATIQREGFRGLVRRWGALLRAARPLDAFGAKRLRDLAAAAVEFDAERSRDCDSFLHFVESYYVKEVAAENAVSVMTIHQSKGLDFDIVILPDLHGRSVTRSGAAEYLAARKSDGSPPPWILTSPRRMIAENDAVLGECLRRRDRDACYDELCVLYVAMTRARKGLYMITSFPGKTAKAVMLDSLVKIRLVGDARAVEGKTVPVGGEEAVCLYERGDPEWYCEEPLGPSREEPAPAAAPPAGYARRPSRRRLLVRVSPSARAEGARNAGALFAPGMRESADLGTAVHELFEKVSWIEEEDAEKIIREWRAESRSPAPLKKRAADHFRRACESAKVREALSRPGSDAELWREKRFEIVIGDKWVTGSFDRVVIRRDAAGAPAGAVITDYKSNVLTPERGAEQLAEHYRPQMESYRESLSRMLALDPSRIALRLVFTGPGEVLDLP